MQWDSASGQPSVSGTRKLFIECHGSRSHCHFGRDNKGWVLPRPPEPGSEDGVWPHRLSNSHPTDSGAHFHPGEPLLQNANEAIFTCTNTHGEGGGRQRFLFVSSNIPFSIPESGSTEQRGKQVETKMTDTHGWP